jgi:hypothetical protein
MGTHRPDGVLAILDEGCGLVQAIFTGAEAITTADFDRQLTTGNPDDPNTEFGNIYRTGGLQWNLITVSAFDTPLFTGEDKELLAWAKTKDRGNPDKPWTRKVETLLGGMPTPEWVEGRRQAWGEDSPRYKSKVLAEFPETSIDSLFTAAELEIGRNNLIVPSSTAFRVIGVDVARYGSDQTVIALNVAGKIEILGRYNTMDAMEVAATVHKFALEHEADQVRVDGIGPGGGVVDRLVALSNSVDKKYVVIEMTASATPPDRTLHRNARAYWYDSFKHQIRNGLIDLPTEGEDADQLYRELGGVRYKYPNGILQIEAKEDIRARGDKSPDLADAVIMSAAPLSYIVEDPLAGMRKGQVVGIDVLDEIEIISPV